MDSPEYFISWGSETYVPLQRFKDLQSSRHDLIRYYVEVLERAETFTQHFSNQPLKSYDMERSLRKNMGCDPPCLDNDVNSTSICWLDIVRHGIFQEQSDGCYNCSIQGKVFAHDQQLHHRVEFCRTHVPHISDSETSNEEVEREVESTQEILTDISDELSDVSRCSYFPPPRASGYLTRTDTKGLESLERAMKIRLRELESRQSPAMISRTPSSSSSSSSGPQMILDDDHDRAVAMGLNNSAEDSSGDDTEDDDTKEDDMEDDDTDDEGPEGEDPKDQVTEGDNLSHYNRQQGSNSFGTGGNMAPDDGTVVSLNPLSLRTPYSVSLIAGNENINSADHVFLPEDTENAVSLNLMTSNGLSSISSPTEDQNEVPVDTVSLQEDPQVDTHVPPPESLTHEGSNTLIQSERPAPRAVKRRKFKNVSKTQKKPKSSRISSYEERSIAIAWMKDWMEAHSGEKWSQVAIAREYGMKFGGNRSYNTLKTWMDESENPQPKSQIVVLKIPTPYLRETFPNDSSSQSTPGPSNGNTDAPPSPQYGPSPRPQNWCDSCNATLASCFPVKIESGLPNVLDWEDEGVFQTVLR
ncbi:hypothetical protein PENCOP_c006G08707 [Penicillium coprophilum]|uniref:Uncharacterized protein n=1 Tax=Penicillium coprophilum TaxID=36646 RepID=A0A1V6UN53_9EURO|nr:hypothetical protein PENCOP_c006G08707 [Penicillium coprophilum]